MLVLFTDFGHAGPYVGQIKAVLQSLAPNVLVIDLLHYAPAFGPKPSAYLPAAYGTQFPPESVFVAIIDPSVGSTRRPVVLHAQARWYVGPDNGFCAGFLPARPTPRPGRSLGVWNGLPKVSMDAICSRISLHQSRPVCLTATKMPNIR